MTGLRDCLAEAVLMRGHKINFYMRNGKSITPESSLTLLHLEQPVLSAIWLKTIFNASLQSKGVLM